MAKEKVRAVDKENKGTTRQDKGVFIPKDKRMPTTPEYLHMSKAQFVEAENKRKERELKHLELDAELDKGTPTPAAQPETAKPRGRPKKIE